MIYNRDTLNRALAFCMPELEQFDFNSEIHIDVFTDVLAAVASRYFVLSTDEVENLTPSQKYAFEIVKIAMRSVKIEQPYEYLTYGDETVYFIGEPVRGVVGEQLC